MEIDQEYPALIKNEQPTMTLPIPMDVEPWMEVEELYYYGNYLDKQDSFMSIDEWDLGPNEVATDDYEGEVLVLEKQPSLLSQLWKEC